VERDDDLAPRMSKSEIQRPGLADVGPGEQPHAPDVAEPLAHDVARAVARAVVNDDDFEARIRRPEQAGDSLRDHSVFVVGRDDDRDEWKLSGSYAPLFSLPLPRTPPVGEGERADEGQADQAERDAGKKNPSQRLAPDRHRVTRHHAGVGQEASLL